MAITSVRDLSGATNEEVWVEIERLTAERDAARREVERLRGVLQDLTADVAPRLYRHDITGRWILQKHLIAEAGGMMVWAGAAPPQEYPDDCEGQCMCQACTACIAVVEQERDEAVAENELLHFCLDQARIVLEHFRTDLPDPDHRRLAEGAMIASAPPGTLPGESRT